MIGVDPGGTWTGIVARPDLAGQPLYAAIVSRDAGLPMQVYLDEVLDTVRRAQGRDAGRWQAQVAVEDLHAPTGWKNGDHARIDPAGIIRAGIILGAVQATWRCHVIPPGGHGSAPLAAYPHSLIGAREKVGTGYRRHIRSAWDVAGAALARPDPAKADPAKFDPTQPPGDPR